MSCVTKAIRSVTILNDVGNDSTSTQPAYDAGHWISSCLVQNKRFCIAKSVGLTSFEIL